MNIDVTNPQHSGIPLNLLYKGVFSTRINFKRGSLFGHYLNKLYKIQFLGIGTHSAEITHDVLQAAVIGHSSINEGVEWYSAAPDKYRESMILEALGGASSYKTAGEQPFNLLDFATRLDEGSPASVLGTALLDIRRFAEVMDTLTSKKEVKLSETELDNLVKRVDYFKESGLLRLVDLEQVLIETDVPILESGIEQVKEGTVDKYLGLAETAKIKMAEEILHVIAENLSLKSKSILLTDIGVMAGIIHKADVLTELLYETEKYSKKALLEIIPGLSGLKAREAAIAHYILVMEDVSYREAIQDALRKRLEAEGVTLDTVMETVTELQITLLEDALTDGTFSAAREIIKKGRKEDVLSFDKSVRQAGAEVWEKVIGKKVESKPLSIEFNHEIRSEESKGFMSLLDILYKDFENYSRKGNTLEPNFYGTDRINRDALIIEYLTGDDKRSNKVDVQYDYYVGDVKSRVALNTIDEVIAENKVISNTNILTDEIAKKLITKFGAEMNYDSHGELWSIDTTYVSDSWDAEFFGELSSTDDVLFPDVEFPIVAEMMSVAPEYSYEIEVEVFGDLDSENQPLVPDYTAEVWGELTSEQQVRIRDVEQELFGDLSSEPAPLFPEYRTEVIGVRLCTDAAGEEKDYEIAVLGCSEPDLKYRRRPPLEPDKVPEDPLFEWVCTEGYVCDDWLMVPLKDFNFENPNQDGFFDPITLEPYFPTGQTDENGDPFVLPPYSILNEPISNGADVGGKEPMSIDPCNLYSFIEYIVKIYDAYKARFHASSPVDTVSRVMNMLFEQVQKLIAEWDETKGYTPDELWRIYRFIRWMALGITNRFYRVKIVYTYGDFVERFEVYPFSPLIRTEGAARKSIDGHGWVLEGHPIVETMQNKATFNFKLPKKTRSSTISFEMGSVVPNRPDKLVEGGVIFNEDFEGLESNYKIKGDGWVPIQSQGGTSLGVEEPAMVRTYRTSTFNVPSNAKTPRLGFNYCIDTNMDSKLMLKKSDGTVAWQSVGIVPYGVVDIQDIPAGDYYFEVKVPQAESSSMTDITFTAKQIQDEWHKVGYQTEWKVEGNVIYEEENTNGVAMVINPQWMQDNEYEMEVEFYTKDVPANYGAIDWIGIVLNYRDANNYYLFGTWSHLDPYGYGGLQKVVNGQGIYSLANPSWKINPDFRFKLSHWHKLKAVVTGNHFTVYIDGIKYLDITDNSGWGFGASGLAAFSNPLSSFRNFKYKSRPRFNSFIDNVVIETPSVYVPVPKPKYAIDYYLDNDDEPRIRDFLDETKRAFSFPILEGEHLSKWVFKKYGDERSISQDASFIDNIVVKGMKAVGAEVVEEFIGCGGHLAVKLLIENLLEYYRRHHQGCKGERNIWIIE